MLRPGGAALLVLGWAGAAQAHSFRRSFADLKPVDATATDGPSVSAIFDIDPGDFDTTLASRFDTDRSGQVDASEIGVGADVVAGIVSAGQVVSLGAERCTPEVLRTQVSAAAQSLRVSLRYRCPVAGQLRVELPLLERMSRGHVHLMTVRLAGGIQTVPLAGDISSWEEAPSGASWQSVVRFFGLGVEHIVIGYDHLLFLLGLLVLAASLREIVQIVTSFTVAHSITLVAAALGAVDLPSRIVESAIALSIAAVGLQNLLHLRRGGGALRYRWVLTFALGLLHGFGFAGVLAELGLPPTGRAWPLGAFNLGVEAGQLAVVALVVPALRALARVPPSGRALAAVAAGGLAAAGGLWALGEAATAVGATLLAVAAAALVPFYGYRRVVLLGGSAVVTTLGLVWFVLRVAGG